MPATSAGMTALGDSVSWKSAIGFARLAADASIWFASARRRGVAYINCTILTLRCQASCAAHGPCRRAHSDHVAQPSHWEVYDAQGNRFVHACVGGIAAVRSERNRAGAAGAAGAQYELLCHQHYAR